MKEEWRQLPGWEGRYDVSSAGRIRSVGRMVSHYRPGVVRKEWLRKDGHKHVILARGGKLTTMLVHRAVAAAFLDAAPGKPLVRHKNSIPNDNRVENLQYGTQKENCADRDTLYEILGRPKLKRRVVN